MAQSVNCRRTASRWVGGAFVFGGHLGFVAGINKEVVFAMIVGKLVSGFSAVILAVVATRKSVV